LIGVTLSPDRVVTSLLSGCTRLVENVCSGFRFRLSPKSDALGALIVLVNIVRVAGGELARRRARGAVG